jgi:hypothetical protein
LLVLGLRRVAIFVVCLQIPAVFGQLNDLGRRLYLQ